MKKTFLLFSAVFLLFFLCSCVKNDISNNLETAFSDSDNTVSEIYDTTTPDEITTENTIDPQPVEANYDDYFGVRKYKYRYNYYRITAPYIDIVGGEAYLDWFESNPKFASEEIDEMLMVSFIKHFNITREQFDEANRNREKFYRENDMELLVYPFENDGEYSYDDEAYEIYNADIIYTFDNELINEYYARPPKLIVENGTNALGETVE